MLVIQGSAAMEINLSLLSAALTLIFVSYLVLHHVRKRFMDIRKQSEYFSKRMRE
jgi:hypothetical protein